MKYNKFIYISFAQGESTTTANISVPITVSRIHIKSITLMNGTLPASGQAGYIYLTSDLTQNSPLGITYTDQTYPYSTNEDIEYVLPNPQAVNGFYQFSMFKVDGVPYTAPANGTKIGMIIEFNDVNELSH